MFRVGVAIGLMFLLFGCQSTSKYKPTPAPVDNHAYYGKAKKRTIARASYQKPFSQTANAGSVSVQKGDTLYAISRKYHCNVRALIATNHLRSPYALKVGQKIQLPKPQFYTVKKGETLYSISRAHQMDMNQLVAQNHLKKPYTLSVGQKLSVNAQQKKAISRKPSRSVKQVASARPRSTQKIPARASRFFSWPVKGSVISHYGPKKNGMHNDGINIKAPKGSKVTSAENGIVEYVGGMKGFDNLVIIKHTGYMSAYAHLEKISVKRGSNISKGQLIGTVGQKGKIPQIHFEIRKGKKAINPTILLR